MPMDINNILVNYFMFCRDHGSELCFSCFCDHRMCNNVRIEDKLGGIAEATGFDYDERDPIQVFRLGAVKGPAKDKYQCRRHRKMNCGDCFEGYAYQCTLHKEVDCEKCFDWVKIIKMEAGFPTDEDPDSLEALD